METSITVFSSFSSDQKVKYLSHLKINILFFSVNLLFGHFAMEILIQPPGEPREHHLGEFPPKKFEQQKISLNAK